MRGELQSFILKGEARKLYREFIRLAKKAPSSRGRGGDRTARSLAGNGLGRPILAPPTAHAADELIQQIRDEFRVKIKEDDLYARKYHLSDGRTKLKMLSEMLGMQL